MCIRDRLQIALCEECQHIENPLPQKKKVPDAYKEIPGNKMASIQRGLADAKAGRTSKVEL